MWVYFMYGRAFFAFLLVYVAPVTQAMQLSDNPQARDQIQIAQMQQFIKGLSDQIAILEEKMGALEAEKASIPVTSQKNIDSNCSEKQLTEAKPIKTKDIPLVSITNEQRNQKKKIIKNCLLVSGSIATIAIAVYFLTGYNVTKTNVSM